MTKEQQVEIQADDQVLLQGYGDRIWRVEEVVQMETGETRYKVLNVEPNEQPTSFGLLHVNHTRRLVERSKLVAIREDTE